ncbi:hypothetical protein [Nocardia fusca]|uniref:hypothetical protein n=1 Tax=Nocardia fusca TaxID=941183 RepID=UPI0007A76321|nr:hypothetical protein [Nocardia fusca]
MTERTRLADLLLAAACVGIPWMATHLSMAARDEFRLDLDLAGVVIAIAVLVACTAAGYAALRWYSGSGNP